MNSARLQGLFSATQTKEVEALARAGLRNPVRVTVKIEVGGGPRCWPRSAPPERTQGPGRWQRGGTKPGHQATPSSLQVHYTCVPLDEKFNQLVAFLRAQVHEKRKMILYMCTCACVDYYARVLPAMPGLRKVPIVPLHRKIAAKVQQQNVGPGA
jgi:ATP-dependent RNA helicase DDX55/SPB4